MSAIRPFCAVRYNTAQDPDVSRRLAPPYDILSDADKKALLEQDPHNFVKIDLPHTPPKAAGPQEVYDGARDTLNAWLADGVMVRDDNPAIYVYHQRYQHAGTDYTRKMFFARLKAEPFGSGSVFPHERTFGGPKEDRLALTKTTRCNLSPIFGLYEDGPNEVAKTLEAALPAEPLMHGTMDGVESRMWAVTEPAVLEQVMKLMGPKPIFIADGHHRYGTALLYREWLGQQQDVPDEHPANYVLCVFCAMEDPGLLILPTHRVLPGVCVKQAMFAEDQNVELRTLEVDGPGAAVAALAELGPQAVAFYNADDKAYHALRPRDPDLLKQFAPDRTPAWQRLGLAFLHAYVIDKVVGPKCQGGQAPEIRYVKSDQGAVDAAHETSGTAFLMQPTTMEELRSVCSANDLMPQKSTYFFPKLASGLVVNPLTP